MLECFGGKKKKAYLSTSCVLTSFLSITQFYSLFCENFFLIPVGLHGQKMCRIVQDIWRSASRSYWHIAYRKCKLMLKKSLLLHLFLLYFKGSSQCYLLCLAVSVKFLISWASGSLLETPLVKRAVQCLLFSHIVLDSDLSCPALCVWVASQIFWTCFIPLWSLWSLETEQELRKEKVEKGMSSVSLDAV